VPIWILDAGYDIKFTLGEVSLSMEGPDPTEYKAANY